MTVLASGSKGNATIVAAGDTTLLVDAGLSCRELLRRMAATGEDPTSLSAILITHEHLDHVAGLAVLARRLGVPVFFTEATHRAWVRAMTPRKTMSYAQWLEKLQRERAERLGEPFRATADALPAHLLRGAPNAAAVAEECAELPPMVSAAPLASVTASACVAEPDLDGVDDPRTVIACDAPPAARLDPAFLPAVEYFQAGQRFSIGALDVNPFTIPHDAADPCGFVFHARAESLRMAVVTDLGYMPPNVKLALREVDVLLLESNHDLEMLKDGPYPWSVKQRVLSRVGHLSNAATAEFLTRDYDGGAHTIVLGHLSEQNNLPDLARYAAEQAIGDRLSLLGNRIVLAGQEAPLQPICL